VAVTVGRWIMSEAHPTNRGDQRVERKVKELAEGNPGGEDLASKEFIRSELRAMLEELERQGEEEPEHAAG
jgi:hypothetical protein